MRTLLAVVTAALAACSFNPPGQCTTDAQCTAGMRCTDGLCTGCSADTECGSWQSCSSTHLCQNLFGRCTADADCPSPYACGSDHSCRAAACASGGGSVLSTSGDADDYIAPGQHSLSDANATFLQTNDPPGPNGAGMLVRSPQDQFWLSFSSPGHATPLVPGYYPDAWRDAFSDNHAGLEITHNSAGCNTIKGQFTVSDADWDTWSHHWRSFAANFEQHCEGAKAALRGWVTFCPKPPVPAPTVTPAWPGAHALTGAAAVDAHNRLFVTDGHSIGVLADGTFSTWLSEADLVGAGGTSCSSVMQVAGMDVGPDGRLEFVLDCIGGTSMFASAAPGHLTAIEKHLLTQYPAGLSALDDTHFVLGDQRIGLLGVAPHGLRVAMPLGGIVMTLGGFAAQADATYLVATGSSLVAGHLDAHDAHVVLGSDLPGVIRYSIVARDPAGGFLVWGNPYLLHVSPDGTYRILENFEWGEVQDRLAALAAGPGGSIYLVLRASTSDASRVLVYGPAASVGDLTPPADTPPPASDTDGGTWSMALFAQGSSAAWSADFAPVSIAADPSEQVYVATANNVYRLYPDGGSDVYLGAADLRAAEPDAGTSTDAVAIWGADVSSDGGVFVLQDSNAHSPGVYASTAPHTASFMPGSAALATQNAYLAFGVTPDGSPIVAAAGHLQRLAANGTVSTLYDPLAGDLCSFGDTLRVLADGTFIRNGGCGPSLYAGWLDGSGYSQPLALSDLTLPTVSPNGMYGVGRDPAGTTAVVPTVDTIVRVDWTGQVRYLTTNPTFASLAAGSNRFQGTKTTIGPSGNIYLLSGKDIFLLQPAP